MTPEITACTRMETHGVRHFGWILPNAAGRYRSIPTMNGTRAIPATVLPTPPAFPTETRSAATIPRNATPNAVDPSVTAWNTPLVGETSCAGTSISTAIVPTIYIPAISTLEPTNARGSVRCGSRISSLIADTSSSPVNAKAICDQKFTVSQFHAGFMVAHVNCVIDP